MLGDFMKPFPPQLGRESEIEQNHAPRLRHEHIAGLDVAV